MKTFAYPMLRCISALLIGALLVLWSQSAVIYLIMVLGWLFVIPGVLSMFAYVRHRGEGFRFGWSQFLGIGSILFGLCLIVNPLFFEKSLMYALGIILSYAGLSEIIQLTAARQWAHVSGGFYVVPVLIMLVGIFILFNPIESANIPFIILGVGCMVYGISDLINVIKFRKRNEDIQEVVIEGMEEPAQTLEEKNDAE